MNRCALRHTVCLASTVTAFVCAVLSFLSHAQPATSHEQRIPVEYRHTAIAAGVPYKILYAVALAESNNPSEPGFAPWQWTLNIAGNGMYFDTKAEALAVLKRELLKGTRNIDICAGQINYKWNSALIPEIDKALDIDRCLGAATQVLVRELHYCEHALGKLDWWCAVERYHSPGQSETQRARAVAYASRVKKIYAALDQ